ncbi:MAG: LysR family transcriptional regulator [Candidatus Eremiobacteraeota bacterium]|nr:LysR family transcriptional regulator [Candidatus Eremiobacteraeota bacterium]MBC5804336.1 LysR family transcriptional regulator [Candidatus Eremiobacteraeota bacterium]MBC5822010.1 LysR family transcriptional regulator [Candidatus Eremiobacteraeota bacterium]
MPSLHQLQTFLDVIDAGSVRAAAERQNVSQPAVSSALATLQREVRAPLFERDGRTLRLAASGKALERYARRVLSLIAEGLEEARAAQTARAGRVRMAAVTTAAEHLLPQLIQGFGQREGTGEIELEVANRSRVWDFLAHWEVELVLAGRPPLGRAFQTLATRGNELVVVGPAHTGAHDIEALARETWLLRESGSGTRTTTEEFFTALAIDPPRLTIGSNGAIRECIRVGLGVSLLAREGIARELADGVIDIIATPVTPLPRPWHLVASAERELSSPAARFVDYLRTAGDFTSTDA